MSGKLKIGAKVVPVDPPPLATAKATLSLFLRPYAADWNFVEIAQAMVTALSSIRLMPFIAVMLLCPNRNILWADMDRWTLNIKRRHPRNLTERILEFVIYMTWIPEFRNVFYFRTGKLGRPLSILCRRMSSLELDPAMKVGPGLFIMHGNGTFIGANEIGENCTIYHQVTLGFVEEVRRLTIGNNVTIFAGAKVVGNVRVGDNVRIGANSLVIKDVPPNVTVIGVPAVVFWDNGPHPVPKTPS
jgi:serine O-acetyltransferase